MKIFSRTKRRPVENSPPTPRMGASLVLLSALFLALLLISSAPSATGQDAKSKDEKKEAKKVEPFKIQQITQGMGLYSIGPVSPDKKSVLLIAKKPDASPNLYVMNIGDHSIRPPLTNLKRGVTGPQWSPDGQWFAFAGFNETAS